MKNHSCKCETCTCKRCLCGPYAHFFGVLGNENRLWILNALREKPMPVSGIAQATGLEQSHVSHGLKLLGHEGLVRSRVQGKYRIYALNARTMEPLFAVIDKHIEAQEPLGMTCRCCDEN